MIYNASSLSFLISFYLPSGSVGLTSYGEKRGGFFSNSNFQSQSFTPNGCYHRHFKQKVSFFVTLVCKNYGKKLIKATLSNAAVVKGSTDGAWVPKDGGATKCLL